MKIRASILLVKNRTILLMHRLCEGKDYYILPGGGVEIGEDSKMAAIREAQEEANISIKIERKVLEYIDSFDGRKHDVFLVTQFDGEIRLGGPEAERNNSDDQYILEWHAVEEIGNLNFFPAGLKEKIGTINF